MSTFAEGVKLWFDNNCEDDHDQNHVDTREELIDYDPRLADIRREVFGDTDLWYTKPPTLLDGHLAGYDPSDGTDIQLAGRLNDANVQIRRAAQRRNKSAPKR